MRVFHDTWLVFRRSLGLSIRQPAWLIAGIMQPFIYLFLFGPLLNNLTSMPGFPPGSAFNTFVPGLMVMVALFGSTFVGFGFIDEMRHGVVERMRVTPMSRTAAVLGRTLRDVVGLEDISSTSWAPLGGSARRRQSAASNSPGTPATKKAALQPSFSCWSSSRSRWASQSPWPGWSSRSRCWR